MPAVIRHHSEGRHRRESNFVKVLNMNTSSIFICNLLSYRDFYLFKVKFLGSSLYIVFNCDIVFHSLGSAKKHIDNFYNDRKFDSK